MNLKLLIFFLIILSFRFYFFYQNQTRYTDRQRVSFETAIFSEPQVFGSQQVFTANLASNQRIRITTSRFPEFHYGESMRVSGPIQLRLLNNKNMVLSLYFPKIEAVNPSNTLSTSLAVINNLRQKLISLFSKTLPAPYSSLLMGIIFGIKEQMPKDFSDNLRTSGVFHVIAASGMNVTLIGGFISTVLAFFLKRQIAIILSIAGIIFYAVLAGLEASIIRASIMGILVFSSQIMGRQTLAANGLFLAGFVMLFISPNLVSDIGFQLSFASTVGILYIKRLPTTVAAQIATLPILLANFGTYSIYSVLVNGLVLWTVPILMMVGGIGAILGLSLETLGQLLIYLCYPLLLYFESVVRIFGRMGGIITLQALSWQFIVGYYCLLGSGLIIFRKK